MPASPKHKKGGLLPSFSLLKPAFRKLPSYSRRHKSPEVHALDPTQRIATTVSTLSAAGVPVSRSGIAAASNVATHTVIGKGNARRFKMDTTGRGLPIRAFPEATTRRVMQAYCASLDVKQVDIEKLYKMHRERIEDRCHEDGGKKKFFDFSIDNAIEVFNNHRVEIPSYIVLSYIYVREFPGLPAHDGKDPRAVSFSRYIIWSCEICRLKDYEMIELFFRCLLQRQQPMDPDFYMNMGFLKSFFRALHPDFDTNKRLKTLFEEFVPHNNEGIKFTDLVRISFKYPPLLYPILDFQRVWRRKIFGENYWATKLSLMHDPDMNIVDYMKAQQFYNIIDADFNLFARLHSRKDGYKHATKSICLDMLASVSPDRTAPKWEDIDRDVVARLLKTRFGYQVAYEFMDLLDIREPHVNATLDRLKLDAVDKGELIYDEWQKHDFFHNKHTNVSLWDNRYVQGATVNVNFGMDLDNPPDPNDPMNGGDNGPTSILKKQEQGEEGGDDGSDDDHVEKKKKKKKKKSKKEKKEKKAKVQRNAFGDVMDVEEDHDDLEQFVRDPAARRGGEQNVLVPASMAEAKEREMDDQVADELLKLKTNFAQEHQDVDRRTSNFAFASKLGVD